MAGKHLTIAQMAKQPSKANAVRNALQGTKIPVAAGGELRIVFFDHDMPAGELFAAPFSVRFEADTLVTYGWWYINDAYGNPVEVKAAYHYCIKAFKAALPLELFSSLQQGMIRMLSPDEREKIVKGLKRYQETEPWLDTVKRDTPVMRSLLGLKATRVKSFSSLERYSRALGS